MASRPTRAYGSCRYQLRKPGTLHLASAAGERARFNINPTRSASASTAALAEHKVTGADESQSPSSEVANVPISRAQSVFRLPVWSRVGI